MQPLKKISPLHERAMMLRAAGYTYKQIGKEVNRVTRTIEWWFCQDPTFRAAYAEYIAESQERARNIIFNAAPDAAERMIALTNHRVGVVALGASKDILDRSGLKPSERHELTGKDGQPLRIETWIDLVSRGNDSADSNDS